MYTQKTGFVCVCCVRKAERSWSWVDIGGLLQEVQGALRRERRLQDKVTQGGHGAARRQQGQPCLTGPRPALPLDQIAMNCPLHPDTHQRVAILFSVRGHTVPGFREVCELKRGLGFTINA